MSEEIKNHIYKTDETALEALAERNKDLETAIQFASGEGLSREEIIAKNIKQEQDKDILSFSTNTPQEDKFENTINFGFDSKPSPSTDYLDARLTLLEQAQTELEQRVAKTFKEAGFKF